MHFNMAENSEKKQSRLDAFIETNFTKTFRILFVVFMILCLFAFWGWFVQQFDKAKGVYYIYKGDKAYREHQLAKAIGYYVKGTKLYPEHYEALFNLGNIYVVYENYYGAALAYENAINHKPDYTMAKMNLGIISAEKLGDFDKAIVQYQSIINQKRKVWIIPLIFNSQTSERENKGIAYYNMGLAYRQKAFYDEKDKNRLKYNKNLQLSLHAYKNAVRILKKSYDARFNLALTNHLLGNYQQAGLGYCKAIELWPMNYDAHYNLAILLRHLKMYKESINEFEKAAITASSNDVLAHQASYIFDILIETSSLYIIHDGYKELVKRPNDDKNMKGITSVKGKITATEELDKVMFKNLKTCESKSFFKKYE